MLLPVPNMKNNLKGLNYQEKNNQTHLLLNNHNQNHLFLLGDNIANNIIIDWNIFYKETDLIDKLKNRNLV